MFLPHIIIILLPANSISFYLDPVKLFNLILFPHGNSQELEMKKTNLELGLLLNFKLNTHEFITKFLTSSKFYIRSSRHTKKASVSTTFTQNLLLQGINSARGWVDIRDYI